MSETLYIFPAESRQVSEVFSTENWTECRYNRRSRRPLFSLHVGWLTTKHRGPPTATRPRCLCHCWLGVHNTRERIVLAHIDSGRDVHFRYYSPTLTNASQSHMLGWCSRMVVVWSPECIGIVVRGVRSAVVGCGHQWPHEERKRQPGAYADRLSRHPVLANHHSETRQAGVKPLFWYISHASRCCTVRSILLCV